MDHRHLSENIAGYRKSNSMTQAELASRLGVSHQAVSLWERGETLPDIALLPTLAQVLGADIGALFRAPAQVPPAPEQAEPELFPAPEESPMPQPEPDPCPAPPAELPIDFGNMADFISRKVQEALQVSLHGAEAPKPKVPAASPSTRPVDTAVIENGFAPFPFPEDGKIRAALFVGSRLCKTQELPKLLGSRNVTLSFEGAVNAPVYSMFSVSCDTAYGPVYANGNVSCDTVQGELQAGGNVSCDSVEGDLTAGGSVSCDSVMGDVSAGTDVTCSEVAGNVSAGTDVTCSDVAGSVSAGSSVECGNVMGSVTCGGNLNCGDIGGTVDIRHR